MRNNDWSVQDYGTAMKNAVLKCASSRYLRESGEKILFNGFWREGNKQNVCIWPSTATWHDAKTGEGGGCKEFAKSIFNLSLPDFMNRFGSGISIGKPMRISKQETKYKFDGDINHTWQLIYENNSSLRVNSWLESRGLKQPARYLAGEFTELLPEHTKFFGSFLRDFLNSRLELGPQILCPIRGVGSNNIENILIRSIKNCSKDKKSRLLPGLGGWHDSSGAIRAYGQPCLINDFPNLILLEGMADYFGGLYLLHGEHTYLPIGVPSASSLVKWAEQLIKLNYNGSVTIVYQLDRTNGQLSTKTAGVKYCKEALKIFLNNSISSQIFNWHRFFLKIHRIIELSNIHDVADIFQESKIQNTDFSPIKGSFLEVINER